MTRPALPNNQSKVSPSSADGRTNAPIVAVAMSGGVDSSLAAALLQEQGYHVIGVYMKNWSTPIKGVEHCPWIQDQFDARRVADQLGIALYTVSFEREYKQHVVDTFLADYAAGRTPNPDVLCNQWIKFDHFWQYAQTLGAEAMATGHYARIKPPPLNRRGEQPSSESNLAYQLLKGVDPKKDQTYFLWAIDPNVLRHVLFPLGHLTKEQVRHEAKKRGLVTADKKDSQGICFIGEADLRDWLQHQFAHHPGYQPGKAVDRTGRVVGRHRGAGFYTIGQRVGIADIQSPDTARRPVFYVVATDMTKNIVTVGDDRELYSSRLSAESANWLAPIPKSSRKLTARIRHGQSPQPCGIVRADDHSFSLVFDAPQRAITPGQSAVLYDGDVVVGGAIIASAS